MDSDKFIDFLVGRGCYEEYKSNFYTSVELEDFLNNTESSKYISSAFFWDDVNRGTLFWRRINSEWISYLYGVTYG